MIANLEQECASQTLGSISPAFDVYLFKDLLQTTDFDQLRSDFHLVRTEPKNNDLYKFRQSKDLLCQTEPTKRPQSMHHFSNLMLGQVRQHLEKLTGLKLSERRFDITTSHYGSGDYLLCHNDDIKDSSTQHARALAFVYYLNSESFSRSDGGALILYKPDERGEPAEKSHHLSPIPNSLVVFRTSPISWHCVEEVHGRDDRLSINGWFHLEETHSATIGQLQVELEPCPYELVRPSAGPLDERIEKFFKECISGEYLMEKTCYLVRRKFKKDSEINLINFLVREKYDEICAELKRVVSTQSAALDQVGPHNKRHYKRFRVDMLPPVCRDLFDAFKSELFFMLLARLTGLDLQPPGLIDQGDKLPGDSSDEDPDDMDDDDEYDDDNEDDQEQGEEDNDSEIVDEEGDDEDEESADAEVPTQKRGHEEDENGEVAKRQKRLSDPLARLEFRHLTAGSYTLVHDYAFETGEKSALDVVLHFNHDFEVKLEDGGYIAYIDGSNEDEGEEDEEARAAEERELLTIEPKSNCLSLVYREEGTCRFLKYINKSHKSDYQDLSCVYYEKTADLPSIVDVDKG